LGADVVEAPLLPARQLLLQDRPDDVRNNFSAFGMGAPHEYARPDMGTYQMIHFFHSFFPSFFKSSVSHIQVPSHFHVDVFKRAGVTKEIVVVPEAIDTDFFNPELYKPIDLPVLRDVKYKFLSVFKVSFITLLSIKFLSNQILVGRKKGLAHSLAGFYQRILIF
jgi:glycosyltransferase involved in cell wall biosynthesis